MLYNFFWGIKTFGFNSRSECIIELSILFPNVVLRTPLTCNLLSKL